MNEAILCSNNGPTLNVIVTTRNSTTLKRKFTGMNLQLQKASVEDSKITFTKKSVAKEENKLNKKMVKSIS